MNETITNRLLRYDNRFALEDLRREVEAVLRRRCLASELERARQRAAEEGKCPRHSQIGAEVTARRLCLEGELRRARCRPAMGAV